MNFRFLSFVYLFKIFINHPLEARTNDNKFGKTYLVHSWNEATRVITIVVILLWGFFFPHQIGLFSFFFFF